jgi:hypothetical protein
MPMKNIIFGLLLISVLAGCTYRRPTTPEEDERARRGLACLAEEKLIPETSSDYYSFCLGNFEQRGKLLAKSLRKADPLAMCQYKERLDITPNSAIAKEVKRRGINCAALLKREAEKEDREYQAQQKRLANPALYSCLDNGFKRGTQAMATCMASWKQQQQQQELLDQQQAISQAQQQELERARMDRAWQNLGESFNSNRPTQTNCTTWGNSTNCTTY